MKYICSILFLTIFTISCSHELENHDWEQLDINLKTVMELPDSTERNSAGYLSHPNYVVSDTQGRIIVGDEGRNELLVFNQDGKFVYTIGERGPGPAEFRNIGGMTINRDDELLVFDRASQTFKKFTSDGDYLTSYSSGNSINARIAFEEWENNHLLFYVLYRPDADTNNLLHIYSEEFDLKGEYISVQELEDINQDFLILGARDVGSHFVHNGVLYFAPAMYNGFIYEYDIENSADGSMGVSLKNKVRGLTFMEPVERFNNEILSYADATATIRGETYQFLVHNQSKGLFRLNNGRIIHFTHIEHEEPQKRVFGVELYDENMVPVGYAPLKEISFDRDRSNMLEWEIFWKDKEDRFYIIDRSVDGPPVLRVAELEGIGNVGLE